MISRCRNAAQSGTTLVALAPRPAPAERGEGCQARVNRLSGVSYLAGPLAR